MNSYFKQESQSIRQISDLRFGIPIIIGDKNGDNLLVSIETLNSNTFERLKKFFSIAKSKPYIAITKKRANLLNVRVYETEIARIKIPKAFSLNWIKATADPSLDFDYPMNGPYESFRSGNGNIARIGIKYCKEAQLLPATMIIPIDEGITIKLKEEGLLYHNIPSSSVLEEYKGNPMLISTGHVPLSDGVSSKVSVFRNSMSLTEHYAIEIGVLDYSQPILTRIHSACFTGDILHSMKCDCGDQLKTAINRIKAEKSGIIIYLNQEGRGIGLANKMRAYKLQDTGLDTFEANHRLGFEDDERDLTIGATILKKLGVNKISLLTNNPSKIDNIKNSGIKIISRIPLVTKTTKENEQYLESKREKSGHIFIQN